MAYSKHLSALPLDPPTAFRPRLRAALRELARERPEALTVRDAVSNFLRVGSFVTPYWSANFKRTRALQHALIES